MQELIGVEEARQIVLDTASLLPIEPVLLAEVLGRTLAEPVVSRDTIPPFASSAMDGFAVRAVDLASTPADLTIIETIPAGTMPAQRVETGMCARIMTGAPVPDGADAIAPVEWTTLLDDGRVQIARAPEPGQFIRPAGQDVAAGAAVFDAGTVVTPPVIGMLATLGFADVAVRRAPTVAVVSTGDEIVDVDVSPGPGQIRNSNGPALAAQVVAAGGVVLGPFHAADNEASIRAVLDQARAADVLVFSGGVSMGEHDLVRRVLDAEGWAPAFWRVRQRPGKPLAFGTLDGKPVFGLPGNPVSSSVCFEQYVRPLLAAMLGRRTIMRPTVAAVLDEPIRKAAGLHHFVRGLARVDDEGRLHVRPTGAQGSNLYSSMVHADGLIHLAEGLEDPAAGTEVAFEGLSWRA
ncbi:MAG: molybdopterin molybdotransferase MoeA [Rhodothermaceae bacterium]|nr:molybdopterin molybdotransferase MoeA [Rhodothermaceae bacterium]